MRKLLRTGEILAPRDADDGGSAWFVRQKAWVVSSGQRVKSQSSADGCPIRVFAVRFGRPWGRVARGIRISKGVYIERSNFGVEWGFCSLSGAEAQRHPAPHRGRPTEWTNVGGNVRQACVSM